jgi:hypothetical protein
VKTDPARELASLLKKEYGLQLKLNQGLRSAQFPKEERSNPKGERRRSAIPMGIVEHGYSHFSVTVHVFACELISMPKGTNLKWVALKDLDGYPMGKIDRQIANMIVP